MSITSEEASNVVLTMDTIDIQPAGEETIVYSFIKLPESKIAERKQYREEALKKKNEQIKKD
jgi:hypothetical protein